MKKELKVSNFKNFINDRKLKEAIISENNIYVNNSKGKMVESEVYKIGHRDFCKLVNSFNKINKSNNREINMYYSNIDIVVSEKYITVNKKYI